MLLHFRVEKRVRYRLQPAALAENFGLFACGRRISHNFPQVIFVSFDVLLHVLE